MAESPKYHDAHGSEGESLMGGEDARTWNDHGDNIRQGSRARRILQAIASWRGILDTCLLLVILGLIVERRVHSHRYGDFEGSGDLTGFAPRVSQQIKTFKPDHAFIPDSAGEFFTEGTTRKWLDIVPKGLGYVKVEKPEAYNNLPTPLVGYEGTVFTTSVTHQLHCLHAIVETFYRQTSNGSYPVMNDVLWHLPHCFEYLRQSIMCCGDTALEGTQTTFPEGIVGSDGWDAKHVCKDYGKIKDYLEENRYNDASWI